MPPDREVLLDRERQAQAALLPILGDVGDRLSKCRRGSDIERAFLDRSEACQHLGELGLSVPVDAGHGRDLALEELEINAVQGGEIAIVPSPNAAQRRDPRPSLRRARGAFIARGGSAADHQLGDRARVGLVRADLGDEPPAPHHGHARRHGEHLAELVRHEEDALPLRRERADRAQERLGLGRRQDRGRLVEDEHVRASIEHF